MTATSDLSTAEARRLIPHLARAMDEKAIRERGPLGAIMVAEREDVRVRRAALVLFRRDVTPAEVVTSLRMAQHLHGAA